MGMIHRGTKTIRTERLTLRRFTPADAPAMFENWASDPRVTRFLSWTPHESVEVTGAILKDWCALYRNPAYYHWVIVYEGQPVGGISVVRQSDKNAWAELGYCIGARWWGLGLTAEAVRGVMDYLFSDIGFHRIAIHHAVDNPASGRVADKCGMVFEGILRGESRAPSGEFWDIAVHSILREEWEARQSNAN